MENSISQHAYTGKYTGGPVRIYSMPNATNLQLRMQEQAMINQAGGIQQLDNRINSIAEKFWDDLGIPPPQ